MALRIWCNPKYFPAELQERAVIAARRVLAEHRVTLEEVQQVLKHIDQVCDNAETAAAAPPQVSDWEKAWFAAVAAAEVAANLEPDSPLGSVWVLDEADDRFGAVQAAVH
jgi:hypothetical protein